MDKRTVGDEIRHFEGLIQAGPAVANNLLSHRLLTGILRFGVMLEVVNKVGDNQNLEPETCFGILQQLRPELVENGLCL